MREANRRLWIAAGVLMIVKFAFHMAFNGGYGYFRDEFYYIECARNLAWGYVDHPPFSMLITRVGLELFGDSLFAIRLLPALAGAATVGVIAATVIMLNGGLLALIIAGIGYITAPVAMGIGNFLSMNIYDHLLIAVWAYFFLKLLQTEETKYWLHLGVVTGVAMMNKYTLVFYLGFILLLMAIGKERKYLVSKQFLSFCGIAFAIFLPHIIWQAVNGWPTLEFMRNAALYKNASMSITDFLTAAAMDLSPLNFALIFSAGVMLLVDNEMKRYRTLLTGFFAVTLFFSLTNGKVYYLAAYLGGVLALSSVIIERVLKTSLQQKAGYAIVFIMAAAGILIAPLAVPVLSPEKYLEYAEAAGVAPSTGERKEVGPLPQHFADMFGWDELTEAVRQAYQKLSEEEKKSAIIFGQNYGQAGAVAVLGKKYNLPRAVSGHNNYFLWGPGTDSISTVIIIGGGEGNKEFFDSVEVAAVSDHPYAMPYERNLNIYIGRKPKFDLHKVWNRLQNYN